MSDVASRLSERDMAELCALADGTLPPGRRAAVEARVTASPELRELVDRQLRVVAATRALASEPAPESLGTLATARRRAHRSWRGRALRLAPRLALACALAAVGVVVALALSSGPGSPTVADAAQLAARPPSGPAPARLGSGTKLAVDVDGVAFPDLAPSFGWRGVGIGRSTLDGRDVTTVFYARGARRVAYLIVSGDGLPRPPGGHSVTRGGVLFQILRVDGRLTVTWRRAGHTCVLTGEATRAEMLSLASWRGGGSLRY